MFFMKAFTIRSTDVSLLRKLVHAAISDGDRERISCLSRGTGGEARGAVNETGAEMTRAAASDRVPEEERK